MTTWSELPLKIGFSVLAVLSAGALYQVTPRFAVSPLLFCIAVVLLFSAEYSGFKLALLQTRRYRVSRSIREVVSNQVGSESVIANVVGVIDSLAVRQQESATALGAKQEDMTAALYELKDSVDKLRFELQKATAPPLFVDEKGVFSGVELGDRIDLIREGTERDLGPKLDLGTGLLHSILQKRTTLRVHYQHKLGEQIFEMWQKGQQIQDIASSLNMKTEDAQALLNQYRSASR